MISFRFLKSSLIYTISGAMPLATGLLLLGVYTQYLDTANYGKLSLYLGFTLLMQVVISFGLDSSFQFFYYKEKNNQKSLHEHLSTILISILAIGVFFLVASLLLGPFLLNAIFELEYFPLGVIALATAIGNTMLKAYGNLLINQQKPARYFALNFLVFLIIIGFTFFFLYYNPNSLMAPLLARFIAGCSVLLIIIFFMYREIGFHFSLPILKNVFVFCIPLFMMLILSWVQGYADRLIINKYMTFDNVGIYDFALKCTLVIDFLVAGLNNSITPKIYSYWTDHNTHKSTITINRYWNAITSIIIITICLTLCAAPVAIEFLDPKKNYNEAITFIPLLSLVFIFRAFQMMSSTPLIFFKKTKVFPKIYSILALMQLTLSFILIYYFGLYGAIWAIYVVKFFEVVLLHHESKKVFEFSYNRIKLIWLPLFFFCSVIVTDYLTSGKEQIIAYYVLSFITIVCIFLLYRKEIQFTFETWKKKIASKLQ